MQLNRQSHQRNQFTGKLNQLIWTLFEMNLHFLNCPKKPTRSLMSLLNVTIRHCHMFLTNTLHFKVKIIHQRPRVPWYSNQILATKRMRRKAKRKWHSSNSTDHLKEYKSTRNFATYLFKKHVLTFMRTSFKNIVRIKESSLRSQSSC